MDKNYKAYSLQEVETWVRESLEADCTPKEIYDSIVDTVKNNMKYYNRQENISHMDNLYDEMKVMREQLLSRIELLEDEVDYLTQENMYYSKQLYQLENDIDSLLARITQKSTNEGLEYQKGSEEINTES